MREMSNDFPVRLFILDILPVRVDNGYNSIFWKKLGMKVIFHFTKLKKMFISFKNPLFISSALISTYLYLHWRAKLLGHFGKLITFLKVLPPNRK